MSDEQAANEIEDRDFFHALADVCGHVIGADAERLAELHAHADKVADETEAEKTAKATGGSNADPA